MAGKYISRVLSRSTTTLFHKSLSPAARGLSTKIKPGVDWGFDDKHWLIIVKKPSDNLTRDQIIDNYIKIMATVLGSEEEARMKIYSVSTRHYYAIGALIDEEICSKLRELPEVEIVRPDSYINVDEKDYGGEPFIEGQPLPYDRKYHAAYWRMREAMAPLPTGDYKDAKTQAPDSETPVMDADNKWSPPKAWLSRIGSWWNGP